MDDVEKLLKRIKNDPEVKRTRYFSSNFLENVGEIFEKYGFEETQLFLWDKRNRRQLKQQANALIKVLDMMKDVEKIRRNRSIGRYVFKNIITIKSEKGV